MQLLLRVGEGGAVGDRHTERTAGIAAMQDHRTEESQVWVGGSSCTVTATLILGAQLGNRACDLCHSTSSVLVCLGSLPRLSRGIANVLVSAMYVRFEICLGSFGAARQVPVVNWLTVQILHSACSDVHWSPPLQSIGLQHVDRLQIGQDPKTKSTDVQCLCI